ncbi:MAG: hypothetical protein KVP17_003339 [Porospora cf. gigantea B]|uniref:uncharacterized protein n=1 Tax=Porospora cf. gigantea B TaxID=2853592 RepID=UPI003571AFC2|nr:MAG: hypothetical protein KVP17_003339 [Porospora cf. gigantea B]
MRLLWVFLGTLHYAWPLSESLSSKIASHFKYIATESSPLSTPRTAYLDVIEPIVDYWTTHQTAEGAIIDPWREREVQYSTAAFGYGAATIVKGRGRDDLKPVALLAVDHSIRSFAKGSTADSHGNFFSIFIAAALPLVEPYAPAKQMSEWKTLLSDYDVNGVYVMKGKDNNWSACAYVGESLMTALGLRNSVPYCQERLGPFISRHFLEPSGVFWEDESPMAYDVWTRGFFEYMLLKTVPEDVDMLQDALQRGGVSSLFLQSPSGELPTGGRSSLHTWNEAAQSLVFEARALRARSEYPELEPIFRRAARRSLLSIKHWVRDTGDVWVVKNKRPFSVRHGFHYYSNHSNYNMILVGFLSMAYELATDGPELLTPAEVGGYTFWTGGKTKKFVGNCKGTHVLLDAVDLDSVPKGLTRIHRLGMNSCLGPSEGVALHQHGQDDQSPPDYPIAVGPGWGPSFTLAQAKPAKMSIIKETATSDLVEFGLTWNGSLMGPSQVFEHFSLTPNAVEYTVQLENWNLDQKIVVPLFHGDGTNQAATSVVGCTVRLTYESQSQSFSFPGCSSINISPQVHDSHNGYFRRLTAEFPPRDSMKMLVSFQNSASSQRNFAVMAGALVAAGLGCLQLWRWSFVD